MFNHGCHGWARMRKCSSENHLCHPLLSVIHHAGNPRVVVFRRDLVLKFAGSRSGGSRGPDFPDTKTSQKINKPAPLEAGLFMVWNYEGTSSLLLGALFAGLAFSLGLHAAFVRAILAGSLGFCTAGRQRVFRVGGRGRDKGEDAREEELGDVHRVAWLALHPAAFNQFPPAAADIFPCWGSGLLWLGRTQACERDARPAAQKEGRKTIHPPCL